jgi:hypothetical protein
MTIEEEVEDFLEHHGIRGMRWGVRNKKKRPQNLVVFVH